MGGGEEARGRECWHVCKLRKLVDTYIALAPETWTDDKIVQHMKDSAAFNAKGGAIKCTHQGVFYNPHLCGESSSKPQVRPPPMREQGAHLKRMMCLLLRAQDWQLNDQQLFFIYDGGKAGDTLCISLHVTCRLQISKTMF